MNRRLVPVFLMLALPLAAQQRAAVGDMVPDFSFGQMLRNDGRQRLSDFYGQPVVLDFWGVHCPPCIGAAVPAAIKHDHEHASSGLVTVLVHSQQATPDQLQAFMFKMFPDSDCFLTTGCSTPTPEFSGIPHASIIGVDGKLLWDGHALENPKRMDELIAAELVKVKKGWGETAEHKKVRAVLYGKDDLAGAAALVAAMPEGEAKTQLQAEIDRRYTVKKKAVEALVAQGRIADAQGAAKDLLKAVGTKADWAGEVQPMLAEFDSDANKAEIAAEKKLAAIEKQLREKKRDPAKKALEALVKSAGSTKVGERAQRYLTALATELP
jgi:thiol-disulfide isomerase/thioredoxin